MYHLDNGEYACILSANKYAQNINTFAEELKNIQLEIQNDTHTSESLGYDISILPTFASEKEKMYESVRLAMKKLVKEKQRFMIANNYATQEQIRAKENIKTVHMIKDAIRSSRIVSYFQPIINNSTQ